MNITNKNETAIYKAGLLDGLREARQLLSCTSINRADNRHAFRCHVCAVASALDREIHELAEYWMVDACNESEASNG